MFHGFSCYYSHDFLSSAMVSTFNAGPSRPDAKQYIQAGAMNEAGAMNTPMASTTTCTID